MADSKVIFLTSVKVLEVGNSEINGRPEIVLGDDSGMLVTITNVGEKEARAFAAYLYESVDVSFTS